MNGGLWLVLLIIGGSAAMHFIPKYILKSERYGLTRNKASEWAIEVYFFWNTLGCREKGTAIYYMKEISNALKMLNKGPDFPFLSQHYNTIYEQLVNHKDKIPKELTREIKSLFKDSYFSTIEWQRNQL